MILPSILEQNNGLIFPISLSLIYLIYYLLQHYVTVRMKGNYDTRKKNLGRTLPYYPNGWYVALKSTDLKPGEVKNVDISGENLAVFRSPKGDVYALNAYCSHMGANLGVGGKVVNDNCVQCPFHGWLFNGETGQCVDHDKKPILNKTIEYPQHFGQQNCKSVTWKEGSGYAKQRKFPTKQLNGLIYVWIHSDEDVQPYFQMINGESFIKNYSNRGQTIHDIRCHAQDIPQNGADIFHFKYIHRYLIAKYKMFEVSWNPQWKRGDDAELHTLFEHKSKKIKQFKQRILKQLIQPLPNKQYYSFANVDNYLILPIIGPVFVFNLTIVQMGPGIVNIFLKTHFFQVVFFQYLQSQGKFHQRLFHEMYCSTWLPYWLTHIFLYAEGMQVYYDMLVWEAKKVSYKLHYKENEADRFIKSWREWFSQHYQGCQKQLRKETGIDW